MLFKNFKHLFASIALFIFCAVNAQQTKNWNGKKCAVVLTYDDALNIHLDKVIPMLDKYNLKGTFYLIGSSPNVVNRIDDWRKAAKKGHELGNHTFNHPCDGSMTGREWVPAEADLSKYTVSRAVNEIKATNALLYAIDGKKERTFAFPCGDMKIGDTYFYDLVKDDFAGARGVNSTYVKLQDVNLNNITAFGQSDTTAAQMIRQIEEAEKQGSFIVFLFHGVGGEHPLNVSEEEHTKLLEYLKKREKEIWVATMVDVAKYIREKQN
ncbi:polysaccharide deacetylase family protein [Flavobacterium suzhouense]|uniref:Polysaccharide deacetylase family protein n=1 Tax=Flavobacterium suzhouense TaxID=1529638 RepID=A0ABW5NST0_9FLAO